MKIMSWNINGIRAVLKKGLLDVLEQEKPDIACFQEIKISESSIEKENFAFNNYVPYWNSAQRPGYSGTLTLIKKDILDKKFKQVLSVKENTEGRVQQFEFKDFYFLNCYFPNSGPSLKRLDYKLEFDNYILKTVNKLQKNKAVIIAGDFNVAHQEIDIARPQENEGNAGFTQEERTWMSKFLNNNFIDSFRYFYPKKVQYSWWSYRTAARKRNVGWRLDYFCLSDKLIKQVQDSYVLDNVMGSDHAPLVLKINV